MVCKFVRAKLLKWLEIFQSFFSWLTFETINLDDYRANSQNFHELAKDLFCVCVESVLSLWFLG